MGKFLVVWGQGIYGKSMYLLFNFALDLKLFFFKVYLIRERVKQKPHHLLWPNPQIGKLQPVDQIWPST